MKLAEIKRNFGKLVRYIPNDAGYLLTACIMRQTPTGEYFYQAELQDLKAQGSLVICRLEDIESI